MLQPQRLGVLVKYGEGPHMSALALIPIALAFTWLALEKRRPWAVALAAVFSAGVAANNFYGATALAVFYPILVWSFWITRQEKRIVAPAIAIPRPGLRADGLLAGALVLQGHGGEHEVRFRARHHLVHLGGGGGGRGLRRDHRQARARQAGAHLGSIRRRLRGLLLAQRAGQLSTSTSASPANPCACCPELDMIYIMAIVLLLRWMWDRPGIALRGVAVVIVLAAFYTTTGYIRHAWHMFPLWPDYQNRVEYRMTDWLWKNMPDARAYPPGRCASGTTPGTTWPQLGGGSEQGLLNGQVEPAQWETNLGPNAAAGHPVDAVHGRGRDLRLRQALAGGLQGFPVSRRNSPACCPCSSTTSRATCSTACRAAIPPRAAWSRPPAECRRSRRASMTTWSTSAPMPTSSKRAPIRLATLTRDGTDAMRVHAKSDPANPSWCRRATTRPGTPGPAASRSPIHKDAMGFMAIDAPPGDQEICLAFVTPLENQVGRVVTGITLLALLALLVPSLRERSA